MDAKQFMQSTAQFVNGIHEVPEVREVRPGHLVRCGASAVIDVSFGLEVGAAAITLMQEGIFGVTVVSHREGKLQYMDCKDAIQQRHVNMSDIALYEKLGICFGRKPPEYVKPSLQKSSQLPLRPH